MQMDAVEKGKKLQKRMIDADLNNEAIRELLAKKGIVRSKSAVSRALDGKRIKLLNEIHDVILEYEKKMTVQK